ncbi:MAG: ATP-binding protein [candidate division KSB1 bacterium]|nr:ATP-binding protein [candidate division KSB1 bacterium]MDZ7369383.1 ATP-binding protein [candidate division KSB1 bacterium]MDZ7407473.1 ATP-binding protein [candidate division KSB1 bacterium]
MTATKNLAALVIKNDLAELARVSAIVEDLGQKHGVSPEALYAVNLALEEILVNVISYGYADQDEHQIIVRFHLEAGDFVVEIEDDARPFNPLEAPTPDVEAPLAEKPIGGLGIHLTRTMMDGMAYRRERGKNILAMRKKIAIAHQG